MADIISVAVILHTTDLLAYLLQHSHSSCCCSQILSARIMEQMLRLGVIANIQPSFVPTDMTVIYGISLHQSCGGDVFGTCMVYLAYIV